MDVDVLTPWTLTPAFSELRLRVASDLLRRLQRPPSPSELRTELFDLLYDRACRRLHRRGQAGSPALALLMLDGHGLLAMLANDAHATPEDEL